MQQLTQNIRFIGVEDDNLDLFEGQYPITNGISYNSYLIDDEKIAVVDTVDRRRCREWLTKLDMALGDRRPDYLIVQHVEPDHSSCVRDLLNLYPEVKVVATAKAICMLGHYFNDVDFASRSITVGDGGTLSLGQTTLQFITAPMVHWPEVMVTLDTTDGVLFSADAFGSFAMSSSTEAWDNEARRYYCNIVGKYGANVQALMKKLADKHISVIAPLHGPVLRDNLTHYLNLYDKWSRYEPETRGTLVAYASVYGGTAEAARLLATMLEGQPDAGEVVLLDLCRHDVSYAVAEAFRLSRMALCSITYDAGLFPAMNHFLHHIASKNLRNRTVGLIENGSWSPIAGKLMAGMLDRMNGMTVVEPVVSINCRLHSNDYATLQALAEALGKQA